jgi:hypothetical protein
VNGISFHSSIFSQLKTNVMVTVTGFAERQRKDGTTFIALEITGGVELIQSQESGRFYATVRKCSIPSTFNANIAQAMIGQRIEGDIVKVIVEPYDFVNTRTGEVMKLQHGWAYRPKDSDDLVGHSKLDAYTLKTA